MRRVLHLLPLTLLAALAVGCTSSDRDYHRNHIVVIPASGTQGPGAHAVPRLPMFLVEPDPAEYKEKARFQAVNGKCWSTPAFADGMIFVRGTKERAAYDLSSKLAQN